MKKSICFIIALILTITTFASCGKESDGTSDPSTSAQQGGAENSPSSGIITLEEGKMRLITKETYIENNEDFTFPEYENTYSYNEQGRIIKKETKLNGEYLSTTTYTYDEHGNLSLVEYIEPSSNDHFVEKYIYDENNRLIRFEDGWYDEDYLRTVNYEYKYDDKGRMIEYGQVGYPDTYEYDENNNLIRETKGSDEYVYTYDANGRLIESHENYGPNMEGVTKYEYDENSNCISMNYYYNGEEKNSSSYSYNENGQLTGVSHTMNNSKQASYSWSFTYDEYGNITNLDRYFSYRGYTYPRTYEYEIMEIDTAFKEEIIKEQNGIIGIEEAKLFEFSVG